MKKIIIVFLILSIFLVSCTTKNIENDAKILIKDYINLRYDGLNSENFSERIKDMNIFYSEEITGYSPWFRNEENNKITLDSLKCYHTEVHLMDSSIEEIGNNEYSVILYVFYKTSDDINSHYQYYDLTITIVKEKNRYKINNIIMNENIPFIIGDTNMSIDEVKNEINHILSEHNHTEQ